MVRSSPLGSPLPGVQCQPGYPSYARFGLAEPWSMDNGDFDIERILAEHEAHLAGLMPGLQVDPHAVRKRAKKRRRPITDQPNTPAIHASRPQDVTLYPSLPQDKPNPEPEPTWGDVHSDDEELDSLLLEAARLASLEHFMIETSTLDGANSHTDTPTTTNSSHLETQRTVHPYSSTPPAEYNAHSCITTRSKGKGRAD
ncbi:hypothetical protein FS749_016626 [Ceratobasidium sp. UAMH 11750]|nr:hypothetical protein FS749_016626 [Ceratobasidium sp. UAMH 11750]